jgi:hypothetical protein
MDSLIVHPFSIGCYTVENVACNLYVTCFVNTLFLESKSLLKNNDNLLESYVPLNYFHFSSNCTCCCSIYKC